LLNLQKFHFSFKFFQQQWHLAHYVLCPRAIIFVF
jgi:hypothetical protein